MKLHFIAYLIFIQILMQTINFVPWVQSPWGINLWTEGTNCFKKIPTTCIHLCGSPTFSLPLCRPEEPFTGMLLGLGTEAIKQVVPLSSQSDSEAFNLSVDRSFERFDTLLSLNARIREMHSRPAHLVGWEIETPDLGFIIWQMIAELNGYFNGRTSLLDNW